MDFLFGTPQLEKVKRATNDLLMDPDMPYNIKICDDINTQQVGERGSDVSGFNTSAPTYTDKLKNYSKALQKRMKLVDKTTPNTVLLTLCLVECIVKNCPAFMDWAAAPEFVQHLLEVCNDSRLNSNQDGNNSPSHRRGSSKQRYFTSDQLATLQKAQTKALQLIQELHAVYGRVGTAQYPIYTDVYNRLHDAAQPFPQLNEGVKQQFTMKRASTPRNTGAVRYSPAHSSNSTPRSNNGRTSGQRTPQRPPRPYVAQYATVTPEYTQKVQTECAQILNYLQLLRDMLVMSQGDDSDDLRQNDAVQSLVAVVKEIMSRMARLIAELSDEYLLNLTIEYHTLIHSVLQFYDQRCKKLEVAAPELPAEFDASQTALVPSTAGSSSTEMVKKSNGMPLDLSVFNDALPPSNATNSTEQADDTPPAYDYQHALSAVGTKTQQVLPNNDRTSTPFDDDTVGQHDNDFNPRGDMDDMKVPEKRKQKKRSPHKERRKSAETSAPQQTEVNVFEN